MTKKLSTPLGRGIAAAALGGVLCSGSVFADPVPIDLGSWTVVQYELNSQPDASWSLSNGNTTATQSVNADASILLSNFDITGQEIAGSWRVNTSSDDDFMGFVFGYQDRGHYYLFDWKQLDQSDPSGLAEAGMSVKSVHKASGDPTTADLWPTAGSANVTTLLHNDIPWVDFVDYDFRLNFTPGLFEIEVSQAGTVLQNWILADSTYMDGLFGFYNYSQGPVIYNGFTQDLDPDPIPTAVPEPGTLLLIGTGLAGFARSYRRKSAAR